MQNYREKRKSEIRSKLVKGSATGEYGEDKAERLEREYAKRKKIRRLVALGLFLAVAIIAAATFLVYRYKPYDTYELKWDKELSEGSFAGYEQFGDYVLKYSHDGASCMDKTGTELWVDSYEMNNPSAYVAGEYACIFDVQGSKIRIYGLGGQVGSTSTLIPIVKAVVSEAGNCAAILEDKEASYINFYKKDGTEQDISIKTLLSGDGYPIDLSLSPEGTQLITTFAYLDGGVLKSKVVFYDFSEIGKNVPNRLVGGFEEPFQDSLVARVRFINSTYSYAVSDGGIYFFSSKNISSPELVKSVPTQEHIENIFNFKNHVGVVYSDLVKEAEPEKNSGKKDDKKAAEKDNKKDDKNSDGSAKDSKENGDATQDAGPELVPDNEHRYRLVIYDDNGSVALEKKFDFDYETVSSDGSNIYFLGSDICNIMNLQGIIKYSGPMEEPARIVVKGTVPGTFIFCGSSYMREYQFK